MALVKVKKYVCVEYLFVVEKNCSFQILLKISLFCHQIILHAFLGLSINYGTPRPLTGVFRCPVYDVSEWRHAASIIQCTGLCMQAPSCYYFRYGDPNVTRNDDNCGLTGVTSPVVADINADPRPETWYSMD